MPISQRLWPMCSHPPSPTRSGQAKLADWDPVELLDPEWRYLQKRGRVEIRTAAGPSSAEQCVLVGSGYPEEVRSGSSGQHQVIARQRSPIAEDQGSIGEPHGHNVRDDDVDRGQVGDDRAQRPSDVLRAGSWEIATWYSSGSNWL